MALCSKPERENSNPASRPGSASQGDSRCDADMKPRRRGRVAADMISMSKQAKRKALEGNGGGFMASQMDFSQQVRGVLSWSPALLEGGERIYGCKCESVRH